MLYNIYMEKAGVKKQVILENLRMVDRVFKEFVIGPLLRVIYGANEAQINGEYKQAIQLLNRKPEDIYDKYKWYFDFDGLLNLIDYSGV